MDIKEKNIELEKENKRLKDLLEQKEIKDRRSRKAKLWFLKKIGLFFIGPNLKTSILNILNEYNTNKKISKDSFADLTANIIWRLTRISFFGLIIAALPTFLLWRQNKLISNQNIYIKNQTYLIEAQRRGTLQFEISEILNRIDNEVSDTTNKTRSLSAQLKSRIIAATVSMKPYRSFENESLSKPYSYEKGQLFASLLNSNINPKDLGDILKQGNFSHLILKNVTLGNFSTKSNAYMILDELNISDSYFENVHIRNLFFTTNIKFDHCIFNGLTVEERLSFNMIFKNSIVNKSFLEFTIDQKMEQEFFQNDYLTTYPLTIEISNSTFKHTLFYRNRKSLPIPTKLQVKGSDNHLKKCIVENIPFDLYLENKASLNLNHLILSEKNASRIKIKSKEKNVKINSIFTPLSYPIDLSPLSLERQEYHSNNGIYKRLREQITKALPIQQEYQNINDTLYNKYSLK